MINLQSKFYGEKDYNIRYSEVDCHRVLKPSALLDYMQDLASYSADRCGFGYKETTEQNLGWYVVKYHIEFKRYPESLENLHLKTEARGVNRLFAIRDFEIYGVKDNVDRELLCRATSQWMLVDKVSLKTLPPASIFKHFNNVEKREDDLSFTKVLPIARADFQEEFKIRYDDIDVNNHVNNVIYLAWGFEAIPKEFKEQHCLKSIDIVFKKEIKYGNNVIVYAQLDDLVATISVEDKANNDVLCQIRSEYI